MLVATKYLSESGDDIQNTTNDNHENITTSRARSRQQLPKADAGHIKVPTTPGNLDQHTRQAGIPPTYSLVHSIMTLNGTGNGLQIYP
jgi:hypothetical protein